MVLWAGGCCEGFLRNVLRRISNRTNLIIVLSGEVYSEEGFSPGQSGCTLYFPLLL